MKETGNENRDYFKLPPSAWESTVQLLRRKYPRIKKKKQLSEKEGGGGNRRKNGGK